MNVTPLSGFSAPRRFRTVLWLLLGLLAVLFGLLAVLLGGAPASPPAIASLKDGFTQELEIGGGKNHKFAVDLQAGQFLRVLVEEHGMNAAVRLFDSQGDLVAAADNPADDPADDPGIEYAEVTEELAVLATETGAHWLEVTSASEHPGRYVLRVEGPRAPAEVDRVRIRAVKAYWDGSNAHSAAGDRIRSLEQATVLWRQIGEIEKSVEILFVLGRIRYEKLKAHEQALGDFRQAAEFWSRQSGRRARIFEAESLAWIGRCIRHIGSPEEALATFEQALVLANQESVTGLHAELKNLLGNLAYEGGEIRKAIELRFQALDLTRQDKDREGEHRILNNLGSDYDQLGEIQKAFEFYHDALQLAREISDSKAEARYLNNLGLTYRSLGDWDESFKHLRLAADMSGNLGDKELAGRILINLAGAYRQRGNLDEAKKSLDRALAMGREISNRFVQVLALGQLTFLMLASHQPEQAVEYAREAVSLAKSLEEQTNAKHALGSVLKALGKTDDARTALNEALALANRRADRLQQIEISLLLARMDRDAGNLNPALSRIKSAIALIESRRGGLVDLKLRTSFLASKQDYYQFQIDTLMALHERKPAGEFASAALQASEHARARGLLDLLNEADVPLSADVALLEKKRRVREKVNEGDWYRRELLAADKVDLEKLAEAERRLEAALDEDQEIDVELRQGSPQYAALTQPQILDVGEIQRQLLDGKALLLEYSLGAERSFLWAVGPDSFASFELRGSEEIEKASRHYYELLTVRNNQQPDESLPAWKMRIKQADAEVDSAARELSRLILGPVEKVLGDRTLLIVADGALQYIPFAALPIPGTEEPLASRHEIVNLPSASVLAILRREMRDRPPAAQTLAILADAVFQKDDERLVRGLGKTDQISQATPIQRGGGTQKRTEKGIDLSKLSRLTFSKKEADEIAALLRADEVFKAVGFEASKEAVLSNRLKGYRNVHFATHGLLDDRPELTALVLSLYNEKGERQDGTLRLADIYSLRLDAELVVLSACRTALGKEIRGEGLVGLTRGFMNAGAPRVLASLWSVEDRATAELMTLFYRGMLKESLTPAAALRKAQLEMAKEPRWKSPYFWAGFSLQGEWR